MADATVAALADGVPVVNRAVGSVSTSDQLSQMTAQRTAPIRITLSNDKGGVAKTTAAISIAGEAAASGARVLLMDCAPQASATISLLGGAAVQGKKPILYTWLRGEIDLLDLVQHIPLGPYGLDIVPGHRNNDQIDRADPMEALPALRNMFQAWADCPYDFVIIDTDPSYGTLVSMAYMGSDYVVCPVRADLLSTAGAAQLKAQVDRARKLSSAGLPALLGFFLTFFDSRKRTCRDVLEFFRQTYPSLIMDTLIPDNVRLAEAAGERQPVNLAFPDSAGARAYAQLWKEILQRVDATALGRIRASQAANAQA